MSSGVFASLLLAILDHRVCDLCPSDPPGRPCSHLGVKHSKKSSCSRIVDWLTFPCPKLLVSLPSVYSSHSVLLFAQTGWVK
ncbi:hypothetical protein BKA65DRAFT_488598 [Rhexocercosporidium sp. MPI-PUGE-AT-0058]|nr:hypothetical protein BKA65DRAFT_488598 [Rhexocercosporidium sp. MPI-PUGE-AT-0058]